MQRIKIHTKNDDSIFPTKVFVGDTEIENVSNISLEMGVNQVSVCNIECVGLPDNIDTIADVTILDISDDRLLNIIKDKFTINNPVNTEFMKKLLRIISEVR